MIDTFFNKASLLVGQGDLSGAEKLYRVILLKKPNNDRALHALGVVLYRAGNIENGIKYVRYALSANQYNIDAWKNLGRMLHEQGQFLEASDCYRRVLDAIPDDVLSLYVIAILMVKAGEREKAITAYQQLVTIAPDHVDGMLNLGQLQLESGQYIEAEKLLQRARQLSPHNADILLALGNLALAEKNHSIAEKYYLAVCELKPDSVEAHTNLGHLYSELKDTRSAVRYCKRALELKPDFTPASYNLGCAFVKSGNTRKAVIAYQNVVASDPDHYVAHSNLILLMHYLPKTTQADIFKISQQWYFKHCKLFRNIEHQCPQGTSKKILKIGFVSPDFRRHPVAYFIHSFLQYHDRNQFEVYCYSDVAVEDDVTQILYNLSDIWRSVHVLDDAELNKIICDDKIDILVDLAGHTAGNRLRVFAMKPTPLQVTWAGYVGTTGLPSIDYLISDHFQSPPGSDEHACEKIVRMPDDYICYSPPKFAPDVSILPALSNGYVTFGVFNNLAKMTAEAIALWAEILKQVEGARIFLKNPSFDDPYTLKRYLKIFKSYGIAEERIITEGQSPPEEMLARYSLVDIQLDTFPYTGGLTTLESLWMGVPVVTMPGTLFSSRHSLTHLMNAGLSEWVASTREEYSAIVCSLASDLQKLSIIRAGLRLRLANSPVCNGKLFTNNLQQAFRWMWRRNFETVFDTPLVFHDATTKTELQLKIASETVQKNNDLSKGILLLQQKDFLGAAEFFEQVLEKEPDNADAYNNLGIAYFELGFYDDAKDAFKTATILLPDRAEAWKNLGKAIRDTGGNPENAARCFRKALLIEPDFDDAWMMLGTTLLDRGRTVEAVKCFKKCLQVAPGNCDAHSNLLFAINYLPQFSQEDIYVESLDWNTKYAAGIVQRSYGVRQRPTSERLRVGYVSGDFKRHPVGYHLLPVLAAHNREEFELFCYATLHEQDDLTDQMKGFVSGWRDISSLSDDDAVSLICNDRIDILVDLAGHTKGCRLLLFARRPAPVQVSWLGYFNTTGVKAIDFLISDDTTVPPEQERWFSEKIVRLPGCRFCYTPPKYAPPIMPPPVLSNGFITFGSFNNIAKVTPDVIELWSLVLNAVPDSRLLIKWSTLGRKKERDRLLNRFARHGITDDRLLLRGKSPHVEMLSEYGDIDIALDPFPFSGGVTSCEALWMGVPVITLPGEKPASRQTAAFLKTVGLPELIANSPEHYVHLAQKISTNHEKLKLIRFTLRKQMCTTTLCNGAEFTRNLEKLYCRIWKEKGTC